MGNASDVAGLVEQYWTIMKVPHDGATKDFLGECQSHTIRANGRSYKYYQRGSGPAVLLVHGLHANLGSMIPIARTLLDGGYQVVLFDAPAHGEALGTTTNPLEVRELIRAIAGRTGDLHAIIAHSLGGLWALSAWNDEVRVRAVVSISTPSSKRFLLDKFAVMFSLDSDTTQAVAAEIEGLLGAGVWTEYSPAENARKITVPGLIIHGASDEFVPPQHAEELHANWSNSTLELIEGTGHVETARSPKVLALISEYLQHVK